MSDQNPIFLDAQVVARVRQFLQSTNISQRWLAREIGSDPGNFSAFLSGAKSLSVNKMAKLLEILGLDRMQLQAKFSGPGVTARIEHFQSLDGKRMKLENGSGDRSDGDASADGPDTTKEFLRNQIEIHRSAIAAISDYLIKAKVNKTGTTGPARTVTDSRKPGPRGDLLSVKPQQMLDYLQRDRQKAEEELAIQKESNPVVKRTAADQPNKWYKHRLRMAKGHTYFWRRPGRRDEERKRFAAMIRKVEAIAFQSGRRWSNGRSWMKCTFKQNA